MYSSSNIEKPLLAIFQAPQSSAYKPITHSHANDLTPQEKTDGPAIGRTKRLMRTTRLIVFQELLFRVAFYRHRGAGLPRRNLCEDDGYEGHMNDL